MLAGEAGLRLSLAGAQTKLPVVIHNGQIALPRPEQATTHILKPPIERFAGTTENEAFAMRLARQVGLSVAEIDYRSVGDHAFLLVERYDRAAGNGHIKRLHQEDFCQALGFPSVRKYAADGGPVLRDCFQLLRSVTTRPARDVLKLFHAAIFNLIIGNADAHAKNYSLLYRDDAVEMAPLYDLLATVAYPDLSPKLAMKIARKATLDELKATDWGRFAEESGLTEPFVKRRAKALADMVLQEAGRVEAGFDLNEDALKKMRDYAKLITNRAAKLSRISG